MVTWIFHMEVLHKQKNSPAFFHNFTIGFSQIQKEFIILCYSEELSFPIEIDWYSREKSKLTTVWKVVLNAYMEQENKYILF